MCLTPLVSWDDALSEKEPTPQTAWQKNNHMTEIMSHALKKVKYNFKKSLTP